jgi:Uncharacterised nucleotidyltransferase
VSLPFAAWQGGTMIAYEKQLDHDRRWAFREGSMHFEKESAVHKSLERITRRLEELGIPYAVVGGMALFFHGLRRFTEDVDILVTREGLQQIHQRLEGLGYLPPFTGSKHLRDTDSGVRIEFLVTGDYPGDGLPKAVSFPDPKDVSVEFDGMRFLSLPTLIELKLASGMTNPRRTQDLVDVQRLIETLNLSQDFADQLNPFVQEKYRDLWTVVHTSPP